eukprot:TRINITY_DN4883_c0_g3_i1.p1 TRINITY_DN4883_c0_g3~~TRINITY_DN4883_c0_g3_i1.p1  ORF type:complete len:145 (+),score=18.58 TRINITY_DN4883_c0_g3_i1:174-608(+)
MSHKKQDAGFGISRTQSSSSVLDTLTHSPFGTPRKRRSYVDLTIEKERLLTPEPQRMQHESSKLHEIPRNSPLLMAKKLTSRLLFGGESTDDDGRRRHLEALVTQLQLEIEEERRVNDKLEDDFRLLQQEVALMLQMVEDPTSP